MSGSKTQYLSQKMLDMALGGDTSFVAPSSLFLALSTEPFDPTATGDAMNEIDVTAAPSYVRLEINNDFDVWPAASAAVPATKANASDFEWPAATEEWGTPQSVYVADNLTGGNLLYGADLAGASDVANGDTFRILAQTFIFSED